MDTSGWRFEHKEFFWLYAALGLLIVIGILVIVRREKILARLGHLHLIRQLTPEVSTSKRWLKLVLWSLAASMFILGMCNLQIGSVPREVKLEGADIMICLDVSKSMLAEDIKPNRLTRALQAIEKFVDRLKGDQVGIVIFAGDAFVQLPLTPDYTAAKLVLHSISPDRIPVQGTDISEAIATAAKSFATEDGKNRAVIIITDGEDHEADALRMAEEAGENGIMINTIGVGSESGVPIPEYKAGVPSGYKKDKEGNVVVTKLNSRLLKDIASKANGVYVQATNADIGLNAVMDKIEELDKKKTETKLFTDYDDQFPLFFWIAFAILSLEFIINERLSQLWKRINLFKEKTA